MRMVLPLGLAAALAACLPAPPPAAAPYRAVGTEPGWTLLIDDRELTFIHMDGTQIRQPRPQVINGVAGEIYQTPRLNVNIVHAQCNDGMSDRIFPDKVQIRADARAFEGCGGTPMEPTQLAGTSWQVTAVNGRPVPTSGEYYLRFEGEAIRAKFGCNGMSGRYLQRAATVSVRTLTATRMACAEPAMSLEQQGSLILAQPVIASWTGADRLTLSNANGRIELSRSY